MNKVILIGRLTRDPELRHTSSNLATTTITVAVSRRTNNQNGGPDADFISVVAWDKTAENIAKYMKKGNQIAVEGRIQTRNYENNEGKRVYVTEVVANNVQFLDSRNSSVANNVEDEIQSPFEANMSSINNINESTSNDDVFESFGEKITVADNDLPF